MFKKLSSFWALLPAALIICLAAGGAGDRLAASPDYRPGVVGGVPILMYHKVNPDPMVGGYGLRVRPGDFQKEMAYLRRSGYTAVSLTDLADHCQKRRPLPLRPVVITLDDGYLDNYTYAYPILKKYGMTATVFVVAGTVGGINQFDYLEGRQPKNIMAGWAQLKKMAGGGITIGAHTVRHPHLAQLSPAEARAEIAGSKSILEKGLNRPVEVFCYPYGSFSRAVSEIVRESGFRAAVTTSQGLGQFSRDPFALKRIRVRGDYSFGRFVRELNRRGA